MRPVKRTTARPVLSGHSFQAVLLTAAALQLALLVLSAYVLVRLVGCEWGLIPHLGMFCSDGRWPHPAVPWAIAITCGIAVGLAVTQELRGGWLSIRRTSKAVRAFHQHLRPPSHRLLTAATGSPCDIRQAEIPVMVALCHGLLRPCVVVSTPLVDALDDDALRAVVAHEAEHARRRDPLRLLALRIVSLSTVLLPATRAAADHARLICEWRADRAAITAGGLTPLARALHTMLSQPSPPPSLADLPHFSATELRIAHLAATTPPPLRVPVWRIVASIGATILVAALAYWIWTISAATRMLIEVTV